MNELFTYARLYRESTNSYVTYRFPTPMRIMVAEAWIANELPGWEYMFVCQHNPDERMSNAGYEHFSDCFKQERK